MAVRQAKAKKLQERVAKMQIRIDALNQPSDGDDSAQDDDSADGVLHDQLHTLF